MANKPSDPNDTAPVGNDRDPLQVKPAGTGSSSSTKFPKGVCGNPKGRPKGSKNLSTILRAAADASLSATIDGKKRRITQLAANVWRLAQQGAAGDNRAAVKFIELVAKMEKEASEGRPAVFPFGPEDLEILKAIHARLQLCEAPNAIE